jgi:transcriptional regulator with XRE-family HTH domain
MGSGERTIRQLAAAAGYRTLRRVARDAEIDRMTLRLAARGERTPTPAIVERIARVLRVGPEVLERVFAAARAEKMGTAR